MIKTYFRVLIKYVQPKQIKMSCRHRNILNECGVFSVQNHKFNSSLSSTNITRDNHYLHLSTDNIDQPAAHHNRTTAQRLLHSSVSEVGNVRICVLDEARFQMGHPNCLNMFKNCFLGVCESTGPDDVINLLFSFVEHYFQDESFEVECLIVMLLASLCEKRSLVTHHGHPLSSIHDDYDDFSALTNAGFVSLANSLMMTRTVLLLQQLATEDTSKDSADAFFGLQSRADSTAIHCDDDGGGDGRGGGCASGGGVSGQANTWQCSKLDKVRILTSDLFIAAIFKEAAVVENPLILHYSFRAMQTAIEGIFLSKTNSNATTQIENRRYEFPVTSPYRKMDIDRSIASSGHRTMSINTFSTLQNEEHSEYAKVENFNSRSAIKDNHNSAHHKIAERFRDLNSKSTKRKRPNWLYCWGQTDELAVICQGCAALAGLGEDVQKTVFEFGRTISLIKQMQMIGGLDQIQENRYMTIVESCLRDFPESANKRMLVSVCREYILT